MGFLAYLSIMVVPVFLLWEPVLRPSYSGVDQIVPCSIICSSLSTCVSLLHSPLSPSSPPPLFLSHFPTSLHPPPKKKKKIIIIHHRCNHLTTISPSVPSERNLNPKAACLKRREEEKTEELPGRGLSSDDLTQQPGMPGKVRLYRYSTISH